MEGGGGIGRKIRNSKFEIRMLSRAIGGSATPARVVSLLGRFPGVSPAEAGSTPGYGSLNPSGSIMHWGFLADLKMRGMGRIGRMGDMLP